MGAEKENERCLNVFVRSLGIHKILLSEDERKFLLSEDERKFLLGVYTKSK